MNEVFRWFKRVISNGKKKFFYPPKEKKKEGCECGCKKCSKH